MLCNFPVCEVSSYSMARCLSTIDAFIEGCRSRKSVLESVATSDELKYGDAASILLQVLDVSAETLGVKGMRSKLVRYIRTFVPDDGWQLSSDYAFSFTLLPAVF